MATQFKDDLIDEYEKQFGYMAADLRDAEREISRIRKEYEDNGACQKDRLRRLESIIKDLSWRAWLGSDRDFVRSMVRDERRKKKRLEK